MKKTLLFMSMVLFGAAIANAAVDDQSSLRPAVWRSSRTCASAPWVMIATRTIHFHGHIVDSATVNNDSWFSLYNTTTVPRSGYAPGIDSTGTFSGTNIMVSSTGTWPQNTSWPKIEWNVRYSSGILLNKVGNACVDFLWDFMNPTDDPFVPWRP